MEASEGVQTATRQTLQSLGAPERGWQESDFSILAQILNAAQQEARTEQQQGTGTGETNLKHLQDAYQRVLFDNAIDPKEDVFYFRFLLKFSLEPEIERWTWLEQEAQRHGCGYAASLRSVNSSGISSVFTPTASKRNAAGSFSSGLSDIAPQAPSQYSYTPSQPASVQMPGVPTTAHTTHSVQAGAARTHLSSMPVASIPVAYPSGVSAGMGVGASSHSTGGLSQAMSQPIRHDSMTTNLQSLPVLPPNPDSTYASARLDDAGAMVSGHMARGHSAAAHTAQVTSNSSGAIRTTSSISFGGSGQNAGPVSSTLGLHAPAGGSAMVTATWGAAPGVTSTRDTPAMRHSFSTAEPSSIPAVDAFTTRPGSAAAQFNRGLSGGMPAALPPPSSLAAAPRPAWYTPLGDSQAMQPMTSAQPTSYVPSLASSGHLPQAGLGRPQMLSTPQPLGGSLQSVQPTPGTIHTGVMATPPRSGLFSSPLRTGTVASTIPLPPLMMGNGTVPALAPATGSVPWSSMSSMQPAPVPAWAQPQPTQMLQPPVGGGVRATPWPTQGLSSQAAVPKPSWLAGSTVGSVAAPSMLNGSYSPAAGMPGAQVTLPDVPAFEPEEAAAYAAYRRLAGTFRDWRTITQVRKENREEQAAAVENWHLALCFWEVHLARRYLLRWVAYKPMVLHAALEAWRGMALKDAFNTWRQNARYFRIIGNVSQEHCTNRLLRSAFRSWREGVNFRRHKAQALLKALHQWTGTTLQSCFAAWKLYKKQGLEQADQAGIHRARKLLLAWKDMALVLGKNRVAYDAIIEQVESRLLFAALSQWRSRWVGKQRHVTLLTAAMHRFRSRGLVAAWSRWREFVEEHKELKERLAKAVHLFSGSLLARAWNTWREHTTEAQGKQQAVVKALGFWLHRSLISSWNSWRDLIEWQHENEELAQEFLQGVQARLVKAIWGEWAVWHKHKLTKHNAFEQYTAHMAEYRLHACLSGWKRVIAVRYTEMQAFNEIARAESQRLGHTAMRRLQVALGQTLKAKAVRNAIALRRKGVCMVAWYDIASVRAERNRRLSHALTSRRRRHMRHVLAMLRQHVFDGAEMRLKELAAIEHWQGRSRWTALRGWRSRVAHWRRKHQRMDQAGHHHRTKMLDKAFFCLLGAWESHQDKLERADQHLANKEDEQRLQVLRAWHSVTSTMSVKSNKIRTALAYWIGNTLVHYWNTWRDMVVHNKDTRARLSAAVIHWYKGSMARAFMQWKDWALHRVEVRSKALAYMSVLCGRTASFAFFMLRANAKRKQRSREARAIYLHKLKARTWAALRESIQQLEGLETRLLDVWKKMLGTTIRDVFDAWRHYVELSHSKHDMALHAIRMWMNCRLRRAFDTLRWYTVHRQMARALVTKYLLGTAHRVLLGWQQVAQHQRLLREKWTWMLGRTQAQVLKEAWQCWREWMQLKQDGQLRNSRAVGYLMNMMLGKAWNSWREHHQLCLTAKRVLKHMINMRLAAAFRGWWEAVLWRREVAPQLEVIIGRMRNRDLALAFDRLKENVAWHAKKHVAANHYFRKKAPQVLRAWCMTVKLQLAINLWTGNRLQLAWDQWRSVTGNKKRLRITLHTVAARWHNMHLSAAWQQWVAFTQERKNLRSVVGKALQHWLHHSLASSWATWREFVETRTQMRAAATKIISRIKCRLLTASWNSWLEFMYFRDVTKRVVRLWQNRQLSAAFNTWKEQAQHVVAATKTADDLFQRITTMLAGQTSSGVFAAWREYASRMRRLKVVLQRILGRTLEMAFFGWREYVQVKHQQRTWEQGIIQTVAAKPQLRALCTELLKPMARDWDMWLAFHTWHENAVSARNALHNAAAAVFMYVGGLQRKAFVAWRDVSLQQVNWKAQVAAVLMRMGGFKLARAFMFWRALAPYLVHMKRAMASIQANRIMRVKRNAWAAWIYRVQYCRLGRKVIATWAFRQQQEVFEQWREAAATRKEHRRIVTTVLRRIQNQTLAAAFATWRDRTNFKATLKTAAEKVVGRLRNRLLAMAWDTWWEFVDHKAEVKEKLVHAVQHWQKLSLWQAWNKWIDYWNGRMQRTRADVQYWGRLLDIAWITWHEHVEDAALTREMEANKVAISKHVLQYWHSWALEHKAGRQLAADMQALTQLRCINMWRLMTQAKGALRRAYLRRAFHGWYLRVLFLQEQRDKLRHAAQLLMFGSWARCFRHWWAYTQEQALKRKVFAQKQAAIKEALRIGNQIRARQNDELISSSFKAWRFQVGVFRKVAKKFAAIMQRGLSSAFREWHDYVIDIRAANNRALEHFRMVTQAKFLFAWAEVAPELAERSIKLAEAAEAHWRGKCFRLAWQAWTAELAHGAERRDALRKVFESQVAQEQKGLKWDAWASWREAMARHDNLLYAIDMASKSRRQRIMSEVFIVWQQYVQAMKGDVDPDSPFASPRTAKQDRRLVKRMAVMMGNTQVDAGSDASSELFSDLYDTPHMAAARAAQARQQAFFLGRTDTNSSLGSVDQDVALQQQAAARQQAAAVAPGQRLSHQGNFVTPYPAGYIPPSPVPFRGMHTGWTPTPSDYNTPAIDVARFPTQQPGFMQHAQQQGGAPGMMTAHGRVDELQYRTSGSSDSSSRSSAPAAAPQNRLHGTAPVSTKQPASSQPAAAQSVLTPRTSSQVAAARSSILDRARQRAAGSQHQPPAP